MCVHGCDSVDTVDEDSREWSGVRGRMSEGFLQRLAKPNANGSIFLTAAVTVMQIS